ncbi:MAG: monofunctional biosynthetic peptidoglycan transglycosylase [Betaproteobacteria bacterium]|nr:MAG: monofunctional biosynthetic peptidoglycan transglycosylase [Betaproteobacteria bacterium]
MKRRGRLPWRLLWRLTLLLVAALVVYESWFFGKVVWWIWVNPTNTAFMEARLEDMREKNPKARLRHKWVPYADISVNLKRALIAAEDAKFLDHDGFDWRAIQRAASKNLKRGKVVAGGSTISQQLSKNLFLSGSRTPWRKLQEAAITVMIETVMSKRRILEIYLNVIEWGNGVFGAEAAARHYYRTSALGLSADQSARLAAMVPNPRYYDRVRTTEALDKKTEIILSRMHLSTVP